MTNLSTQVYCPVVTNGTESYDISLCNPKIASVTYTLSAPRRTFLSAKTTFKVIMLSNEDTKQNKNQSLVVKAHYYKQYYSRKEIDLNSTNHSLREGAANYIQW